MNKKTKGFSLLEVMITLVIIAVGMLGVAGMSLKASFLNIENAQKNEALYLANDIVNRMRANSDNAADYAATTDDSFAGDDIKNKDMSSWKTSIGERLVAGTGCIYEEDGKVLVAVAWQSDAPLGDAISNIKKRYEGPSAKTMVGKADACGGTKYDESTGDKKYRQAVVVNTYIG